MTANPNDPVDLNPNPANPVDEILEKRTTEDDFVKYSTYKKTVNEAKNLRVKHSEAISKLAEFEAKERERSEKQLIDDKKYEELLGQRDEELSTTRAELDQTRKNEVDYRKMSSFLRGLGTSSIGDDYLQLVPLDKIDLTEDGSIDQESLIATVSEFKQKHSRLLIEPKSDLPINRVGGSGTGKLSYKEWSNLKSSKDMKDRAHEVDFSAPR